MGVDSKRLADMVNQLGPTLDKIGNIGVQVQEVELSHCLTQQLKELLTGK